MKNVLELENFTGDTERAVQQDFYATIYTCNLASILIQNAQEEYEKNLGDKEKKYTYKINKRIAIAYLKDSLLHALLQEDVEESIKLYDKYVLKLSKHIVPIRNGRKFERPLSHKHRKPKHGRTNKRVL